MRMTELKLGEEDILREEKTITWCVLGYFIVRIDFLSSLQGEQTVRTLPKTNQMLQRLLKSMPKPSRRYVHESIPTKLRVKS